MLNQWLSGMQKAEKLILKIPFKSTMRLSYHRFQFDFARAGRINCEINWSFSFLMVAPFLFMEFQFEIFLDFSIRFICPVNSSAITFHSFSLAVDTDYFSGCCVMQNSSL